MKFQVMVTRYYLVDVEADDPDEALDMVSDDADTYIESRPEANTAYEYEDGVSLFSTAAAIT